MNKLLFILAMGVIILAGCSQASPSGSPAWVDRLIKQFQSEPVGNPPLSIWRYEYNGQSVYYIPAQCCDQYSMLFNAQGNVLCAPDGGFIGGGDGKCPDFFTARKNEQLIWQDDRTP